jgi:hypothetical protein
VFHWALSLARAEANETRVEAYFSTHSVLRIWKLQWQDDRRMMELKELEKKRQSWTNRGTMLKFVWKD